MPKTNTVTIDCPNKDGGKIALKRVTEPVAEGLPDLIVDGRERGTCSVCGESVMSMPRVSEYLPIVFGAIINKRSRLTGSEVSFLRKMLGQAKDVAEQVGVTATQFSRWEHDTSPISAWGDRLLRMLIAAKLKIEPPDLRGIADEPVPVVGLIALGADGWKLVVEVKTAPAPRVAQPPRNALQALERVAKAGQKQALAALGRIRRA